MAFTASKGSRLHILGGRIFVGTMIILCISGLWMSVSRNILFTVFLSLVSLHAVISGWATVATGYLNDIITRWSWLFALIMTIGALWGAFLAASVPGGQLNDLPAGAFFFIASVAAFLFILDVNYLRLKSRSDMHRIARHLWRMGFAAFLATGIFFFGNNHVLPEIIRTPLSLSLPVLLVVFISSVFLIKTYWVGLTKSIVNKI